MNVPWRFFAALVIGFLLMFGATATAFYLTLGVPTESSRWAFEVNQKKRLLAVRAASPKLLLVGGSATLFGISAKEIQNQTGFPAINLGTHAALGPTYILREAQEMAKPGDIVLLGFEYGLYNRGKVERAGADSLFLDYIVSRDPAFFHSLSLMEQWNVFMLTSNRGIFRGLKNRLRPEVTGQEMGVYDVRYVDEWGDQTHHAQADRPPGREAFVQMKSVLSDGVPERPNGFASIESFCKWAQAHQIRVLATYPNLVDQPEYHLPAARQSAKTIQDFFSGLQVPMIGNYTDSLLRADQFFDTRYHLTEEAALARTRRLIPQLMPFLFRCPCDNSTRTRANPRPTAVPQALCSPRL
jgi:hypothetical protein